jgi:hypothetical protein
VTSRGFRNEVITMQYINARHATPLGHRTFGISFK